MKSESLALPATGWRAADFLALTKPRLNFLVVAIAAGSYYLGADTPASSVGFLHTVVGTAAVAGGAAALNQVAERDIDALMLRTRTRPLPEGHVRPAEATVFGVALAAAGLIELALGASPIAAGVAFVTLISYAAVYTPLKRRTSAAMFVGAIPGALPAVIGWTAARGTLDAGAAALFAIVFVWQIPHFLAIAWLYRDDFARAGLPLVPVLAPQGRSTAWQVALFAGALVPISLVPAAVGLVGQAYVWPAATLGAGFLILAGRFASERNLAGARRLFFGSLIYLPLLWGLLIAAHLLRSG